MLVATVVVLASLLFVSPAAVADRRPRRCRRCCPGRWRALRLLWIFVMYAVIESLLLVVLFGFWFAAGFGRRLRTPYWEGIHYDLVEGVMWVFFREAKRVLNLEIVTDGPAPGGAPGRADCWCAAGTPAPATRSS